MTQRLAWSKAAPGAYGAMAALERYAAEHLEPRLYELVRLRASLINGCGYCIDMHSCDALEGGENPQRLFMITAWREAPHLYTERERAALALTEEATRLDATGCPTRPGPRTSTSSPTRTSSPTWPAIEGPAGGPPASRCADSPAGPAAYSRGSTGSDSSASTANTASCTR